MAAKKQQAEFRPTEFTNKGDFVRVGYDSGDQKVYIYNTLDGTDVSMDYDSAQTLISMLQELLKHI